VDAAVAEQRKTDDWQRIKECAQQAERFVKDWEKVPKGMEEQAKSVQLLGWQNHYSPKYGRCYIQLSIHTDSKMASNVPEIHEEMFDAFEGRSLASCTSPLMKNAHLMCFVSDRNIGGDCNACRQYIDDHMNN
jgi:hypothetical protein